MSVRIGILGGTFDPIHVGHLVAAVNVRAELGIDRVLLVVANEPWQKVAQRPVSAAADRLALVAAAVDGYEGLEASSIEIDRGGVSYTADTVAELAALQPGAELFVIVGADVARDIESWVRLGEVLERATLVVVNRPGTRIGRPAEHGPLAGRRVEVVEMPALEISSTDLRERAATGRPLEFLIPRGAIRVIAERGMYGGHR